MNISFYFPELNDGQVKMLERYIHERQREAVEEYKRLESDPSQI